MGPEETKPKPIFLLDLEQRDFDPELSDISCYISNTHSHNISQTVAIIYVAGL